jgi:hypothetical protein
VLKLCAAIAEVRFSAPPDSNRQPDDSFGLFCQYSTGAKQLIGLVMTLAICRGGAKGAAGAPLQ